MRKIKDIEIKSPRKNKALLKLAKDIGEDDNPVIQILHLK